MTEVGCTALLDGSSSIRFGKGPAGSHVCCREKPPTPRVGGGGYLYGQIPMVAS